ncbi:phosphoribosylglycinamide formyltransferase, partial [Sphingomonas sp.]|uniref:phosphoribosylglycinamide formyltransferase n=1 Tax=Sphingomonas sp. TaxID=28214 RepID=UPI0025CF42A2
MREPRRDNRRVAILISGRGSNMRALIEQADGYDVALVGSNKPAASGLAWAEERGIPVWARDSKGVEKADYDRLLSAALDEHGVGTIALAGFMRILSPWFVGNWRGRMVNIHPSLLPKYPGLDTHSRALEAKDAISGCSVHIVTEELDAGQVLGQAEVPVIPGDTPQSLEQRVLAAEHRLYPRILSEFVK